MYILVEDIRPAGAVAVRLRVYDSGLCFICAHLASGEAEGDELKRNYDYSEIVRRGQFPPDTASLDPESDINGSSAPAGVSQVFTHMHGSHKLEELLTAMLQCMFVHNHTSSCATVTLMSFMLSCLHVINERTEMFLSCCTYRMTLLKSCMNLDTRLSTCLL